MSDPKRKRFAIKKRSPSISRSNVVCMKLVKRAGGVGNQAGRKSCSQLSRPRQCCRIATDTTASSPTDFWRTGRGAFGGELSAANSLGAVGRRYSGRQQGVVRNKLLGRLSRMPRWNPPCKTPSRRTVIAVQCGRTNSALRLGTMRNAGLQLSLTVLW